MLILTMKILKQAATINNNNVSDRAGAYAAYNLGTDANTLGDHIKDAFCFSCFTGIRSAIGAPGTLKHCAGES